MHLSLVVYYYHYHFHFIFNFFVMYTSLDSHHTSHIRASTSHPHSIRVHCSVLRHHLQPDEGSNIAVGTSFIKSLSRLACWKDGRE